MVFMVFMYKLAKYEISRDAGAQKLKQPTQTNTFAFVQYLIYLRRFGCREEQGYTLCKEALDGTLTLVKLFCDEFVGRETHKERPIVGGPSSLDSIESVFEKDKFLHPRNLSTFVLHAGI